MHDMSPDETHWYVEFRLDSAEVVKMAFELSTGSDPLWEAQPEAQTTLYFDREQGAQKALGYVDEAIRESDPISLDTELAQSKCPRRTGT